MDMVQIKMFLWSLDREQQLENYLAFLLWSLKYSVGKNGLSICGGKEVIFFRFLSLEEEENH